MRAALASGSAPDDFRDAPVVESGWFHSAAFGIDASDLLEDAASALARAERNSRRALESAEAPNVRLYSEAAHEDFLQSQAAVQRAVVAMTKYGLLRPRPPARPGPGSLRGEVLLFLPALLPAWEVVRR
ncbi:unnamed protein product, partial [Prorocentrum cordatum]